MQRRVTVKVFAELPEDISDAEFAQYVWDELMTARGHQEPSHPIQDMEVYCVQLGAVKLGAHLKRS